MINRIIKPAGGTYTWVLNNLMKTGFPSDFGTASTPAVFYIGSTLYAIFGMYSSFLGYRWNGSSWSSNSAIISGLSVSGEFLRVTSFYKDGYQYLIYNSSSNIVGYRWNGSSWSSYPSIVSGLTLLAGQDCLPNVFTIGSSYYCIRGTGSASPDGWLWNGSSWVSNSNIVSGLANIGRSMKCTKFEVGSDIFILINAESGYYACKKWSGSSWVDGSAFMLGLEANFGMIVTPSTFVYNGEINLIHGSWLAQSANSAWKLVLV